MGLRSRSLACDGGYYRISLRVSPRWSGWTVSTGHRLPGARARPAEVQKHAFVAIYHRLFREEPFDDVAGVFSHPRGNCPVRQDRQLVDEGLRVTDRKEKAVAPRDDHLRRAADIGMDQRPAQGHGLDRRQGKRFGKAAQHHRIASSDVGADILLEPRDHDITLDMERARAGFDRPAHLAVADHQRPRRYTQVTERGDRLDQLQMVLFPPQQRRYADHVVSVGKPEQAAQCSPFLGIPCVAKLLGIHAAVDYFISPREHPSTPPIPPLSFANENRTIGHPEKQAIDHHLELLLYPEEPCRVIGDDQRYAQARKTQSQEGIP